MPVIIGETLGGFLTTIDAELIRDMDRFSMSFSDMEYLGLRDVKVGYQMSMADAGVSKSFVVCRVKNGQAEFIAGQPQRPGFRSPKRRKSLPLALLPQPARPSAHKPD